MDAQPPHLSSPFAFTQSILSGRVCIEEVFPNGITKPSLPLPHPYIFLLTQFQNPPQNWPSINRASDPASPSPHVQWQVCHEVAALHTTLSPEQLPGIPPYQNETRFPISRSVGALPRSCQAHFMLSCAVSGPSVAALHGDVGGCPAWRRRCSCQPSHPHRNANPNSPCPNQAISMFSHYSTTRGALVSPAVRSSPLENWGGECPTLVKFRRGESPAWKEEEVGVFSECNGGEAGGLGRCAVRCCHLSQPTSSLQLLILPHPVLSTCSETKFYKL